MEEMVAEIVSEMDYLRTREQKLRDTNESTNERVKWFAFGTMAVLVGLGAWQVIYLRAYFRSVGLWSFPLGDRHLPTRLTPVISTDRNISSNRARTVAPSASSSLLLLVAFSSRLARSIYHQMMTRGLEDFISFLTILFPHTTSFPVS